LTSAMLQPVGQRQACRPCRAGGQERRLPQASARASRVLAERRCFCPSFSFGAWSMASTRIFARMISGNHEDSPEAFGSGFFSRRVRMTSTRSFGRDEAAGAGSPAKFRSIYRAPFPAGRIAAMKAGSVGLDQLGLADRFAGDETGERRDRAGNFPWWPQGGFATADEKPFAGGRCRPSSATPSR